MSAIVRRASLGRMAAAFAFSLAGAAWIYVELGTDLLGGVVSIKLVTLGGIAILGGLFGAVNAFNDSGCSTCRVPLTYREARYPRAAHPTFRAALESLRAGDSTPFTQALASPRLPPDTPSGTEITSIGVLACARCGQVARVVLGRHRIDGNVTKPIEHAMPVLVEGPVAGELLSRMKGE